MPRQKRLNPVTEFRDAMTGYDERYRVPQQVIGRDLGASRRQMNRYEARPDEVRFHTRLAFVGLYALLIEGYQPPRFLRRWLFDDGTEWPEDSALHRWMKDMRKRERG